MPEGQGPSDQFQERNGSVAEAEIRKQSRQSVIRKRSELAMKQAAVSSHDLSVSGLKSRFHVLLYHHQLLF